uniref:Uncharacterized protein n=1 Tax=Dulem virus 42 TaxID=3145760 RepID=A0AAU8B7R1_9CAUD
MSTLSGNEVETASRYISGHNNRQKNGYYQVSFGKGVSYAKARAFNFAGGQGLRSNTDKNNDVALRFDKWLQDPSQRISGNLFNVGGMKAGKLPGNVLEFSNFDVTVKLDIISSFIRTAKERGYRLASGKSCKNASDAEILADLGLSVVDASGSAESVSITKRFGSDGNLKGSSTNEKQHALYVTIPASKSTKANTTNLAGLNDLYNHITYGGGSAYKESYGAAVSSERFSGN